MINRRDMLKSAVAAGALASIGLPRIDAQDPAPTFRVIDSNVSLFRWPFRRLPLDDTAALVAHLEELGTSQAWAGSFEALLHRDLAGVNRRLAKECGRHGILVPVGSVNLELPDWEEDLRRCAGEHGMPGVRLHPNYHGYALDDPRVSRLFERATAAGLFIQIAAAMEDTRTQLPLMQVPDVDLAPLAKLSASFPEARVQVLNTRPRGTLLDKLAARPGLHFDTARVESTDGIPQLVRQLPPGRVLFGSHAPFLNPMAALIRTHESGQLEEAELRAVLATNADLFTQDR